MLTRTALPTIVLVGASLVAGGLAGYRAGTRVRGRLRELMIRAVAVVVGCAALDIAGTALGYRLAGWVAIGLMGGLLTGLKYGYTDSLRVWPAGPSGDAAEVAEEGADGGLPLGDPVAGGPVSAPAADGDGRAS